MANMHWKALSLLNNNTHFFFGSVYRLQNLYFDSPFNWCPYIYGHHLKGWCTASLPANTVGAQPLAQWNNLAGLRKHKTNVRLLMTKFFSKPQKSLATLKYCWWPALSKALKELFLKEFPILCSIMYQCQTTKNYSSHTFIMVCNYFVRNMYYTDGHTHNI